MNSAWRLAAAALLGFLALPCALEAAAEDGLREAGVARVDVTPDYPVRLNGFGFRREESEGVGQRIWAKALALGPDAEGPLVLITLDNLGVSREMADEVARRLEERAGIPRERVAITFTHTHTAPMLEGTCPTIFSSPIPPEHRERIARYTRETTDALENVAMLALRDRRPARIERGLGKVGFARNRRTEGGPVDHSLPLLAVKDPDGSLRAVYLTYACHCVTLSHNLIGGDWAGYAQAAVEEALPGAVCLVSIGCGSDANPDSGVTGDSVETAAAQGAQICDEVVRLLEGPLTALDGKAQVRLARVELPLEEPPGEEEMRRVAQEESPAGYSARWHLDRLEQGIQAVRKVDYTVQSWCFGEELAMVFLAGEVCVDYALRLRGEWDPDRLWLHGYSNDFCSYVPSERLLQEGGYGGGAEMVYFGLPSVFRPGLEERIVEAVGAQLPEGFRAVEKAVQEDEDKDEQGALEPEESLRRIRVPEGLEVQLMAWEPLVDDPVAIDFGADGSLWVVEMRDYPEGIDGKWAPGGRIRLLKDSDGDGKYDKASVFLDGLPFPTEVAAWRDGVLVAAAPDVFYAEDRDRDGRADLRQTLFTGFATHNYHARVNSLRLGLDRWMYGSGGLFGGEIRGPQGSRADLRNRDFRMDPDTGAIEAVTGNSQQGRVRDAFGEWFGCENWVLVRHYPLEEDWLRANPRLVPPPAEVSRIEEGVVRPARSVQLFELSGPQGSVTSACGLDFYRDAWLGEEYAGDLFVCEPVHHAVVRLRPVRDGATWRWERPDRDAATEFFVSEDAWTRPVQVRSGPDGALWVVDMYREVIEHPVWIPEPVRAALDLRAGTGSGRIFRIIRKGEAPAEPPVMREWSSKQLAEGMRSRNGALRDMIQRELWWRRPSGAAPELRRAARDAEDAAVRAQSLAALDVLGLLEDDTLRACLADAHPGVRARALRLTAARAHGSEELSRAVAAGMADSEARVRLEAAAVSREIASEVAAPALTQLLLVEDDEYVRAGALSAVLPHLSAVLERLVGAEAAGWDERAAVLAAQLCGWALEEDPDFITATFLHQAEQCAAALGPRGLWEFRAKLAEAVRGIGGGLSAAAAEWFNSISVEGRGLAAHEGEDAELRATALRAGAGADDETWMSGFLRADQPLIVQSAALDQLASAPGPGAGDALLTALETMGPGLRERAVQALLARAEWAARLAGAAVESPVLREALSPLQRQALREHSSNVVREAAARIPEFTSLEERSKTAERYAAIALERGDAEAGRNLFREHCAACHRFRGDGTRVGPDLDGLTERSPEALAASVFDPNRNVEENFMMYVVELKDGRQWAGLIEEEGDTSVTLRGLDGVQHVLLRNELKALRGTGRSLMPDGMETVVDFDAFANLAAYLNSGPVDAGEGAAVEEAKIEVAVYFLGGGGETFDRPGPFLLPVSRFASPDTAVRETVQALLAGPAAEEEARGLSSAAPGSTELLGIDVACGVARTDLSRGFESGGGTFSMRARLAQLVFSLTRFESIESVVLLLDGTPVDVFSGEGLLIDVPMTRDAFVDLAPKILVDAPAWGARLENPARVQGMALAAGEGFHCAILDADHKELARVSGLRAENGEFGKFEAVIPYAEEGEQPGFLKVWEESPVDGSETGVRICPVTLTP